MTNENIKGTKKFYLLKKLDFYDNDKISN